MSEFSQIRYESADRVATITLDRPDRLNAFTATMTLAADVRIAGQSARFGETMD
jgi:1,4-dihydroxy-2-naphthoyl-CoA synthase